MMIFKKKIYSYPPVIIFESASTSIFKVGKYHYQSEKTPNNRNYISSSHAWSR